MKKWHFALFVFAFIVLVITNYLWIFNNSNVFNRLKLFYKKTLSSSQKQISEISQMSEKDKLDKFYISIVDGDVNVISFFINKGVDLNKKIEDKDYPLITAVKQGREEIVYFLLENGADINLVDEEGYTPLFYALEDKNKPVIQTLIEYEPSILKPVADNLEVNTLFEKLVEIGDIYLVKLAIRKTEDYDFDLLNHTTYFGNTALSMAIKNKEYSIIKYLLRIGAIINPENTLYKEYNPDNSVPLRYQNIALTEAIKIGDEEILALLIKYGANLNVVVEELEGVCNFPSYTIFDKVIELNNKNLVKLALENGADVFFYCNDKYPLDYVESDEVKTLIENQISLINLLVEAIKINDENKVNSLIDDNVELVNARDNYGKTPLMYANEYKRESIKNILLSNGTKEENNIPNIETIYGKTTNYTTDAKNKQIETLCNGLTSEELKKCVIKYNSCMVSITEYAPYLNTDDTRNSRITYCNTCS